MSLGILSGTASRGLGCCGCCALAPSASPAMQIANAARVHDMAAALLWLTERLLKHSAERLNSGRGDLLVLVRLHARNADSADAGAVQDDRQSALHRRHARHAQELDALGHAFLPVGGGAARLGGGSALLHRDAGMSCATHPSARQRRAASDP